MSFKNKKVRLKSTLIVCPVSLISQWSQEISSKTNLKALVFHGPGRANNFEEFQKYDIVITSYGTCASEFSLSDSPLYAGYWWRVILDEGHIIKNSTTKVSRACAFLMSLRRWCVTGTPLQNNVQELQSLTLFQCKSGKEKKE